MGTGVKSRLQKIVCDNCGKDFMKREDQIERSKKHFCSKKCHFESYSNVIEYLCEQCGKYVKCPMSHNMGRFCSRKCLYQWRRENKRITKPCGVCGTSVTKSKSKAESRHSFFCSHECYSESLRIPPEERRKNANAYTRKYRKEHNGWYRNIKHKRRAMKKDLGGSFTGEEWNNLLEENNYSCKICGSEKKITVDHIIPLVKWAEWCKDNPVSYKWNDIENIQPLCLSCNSRKIDKIEYFEDILVANS